MKFWIIRRPAYYCLGVIHSVILLCCSDLNCRQDVLVWMFHAQIQIFQVSIPPRCLNCLNRKASVSLIVLLVYPGSLFAVQTWDSAVAGRQLSALPLQLCLCFLESSSLIVFLFSSDGSHLLQVYPQLHTWDSYFHQSRKHIKHIKLALTP